MTILNLEYRGFTPFAPQNTTKKELVGNDWKALRYEGIEFLKACFDALGFDPIDFDNHNAFQDNELYLMDFEGLEYNENENIKSMYLNTEDRVLIDVYNQDNDSFITYCIS